MLDIFASSVSLLPYPTGMFQVAAEPPREGVYLSLVIPTYNERENLAQLLQQLVTLLEGVLPQQYEVIVVDDDSPDRTWMLALELASVYPSLRVIRRRGERGLARAVVRGWQVARGEVLGVMDGDLQHPPEIIGQLLAVMEKGVDLAIASRYSRGGGVENWSWLRRVLSRGACWLGVLFLPTVLRQVSDPLSGCFLVKRKTIARRPLNPVGYKILLEVLGRGIIDHIQEVGYTFQSRTHGRSKVTWRQYLDYLLHLGRLMWTRHRYRKISRKWAKKWQRSQF
ncbi:polyprenol monophosphomannose synthase [Spirulina sp. CS-785/01]|uniref:polyprenol monophosphomannose synthase n=1 Tax=Spirulina sp. CS-785/01 TaxID=3021716 RepID=UPI00232CDFAA|nr:polyprenol monophosphomannose synthase [Spirulina sp. CS-785/01]MDB9311984.1 polyprenol monophosphomannose synthase [Spirulina sp. CS-785/01]